MFVIDCCWHAVAIAACLVEHGASIAQRDRNGLTALHRLVALDRFAVVERLCRDHAAAVAKAVNLLGRQLPSSPRRP